MGRRLEKMCKELVKKNTATYREGKQMKKKFKIIDASTGKEFKLIDGQMVVMNNEGVFFWVGNFRDYDTHVHRLSDVCPKYDVVWNDQPDIVGTGSDYLDCLLDIGGFEQYGPIKGE